MNWTVTQAARLFTEQETNQDMSMVRIDDSMGLHWGRRVMQLIERGCPRVTAYDTVAARARKSRRYIQDRYKLVMEFDSDQLEDYMRAGVSFVIASMSRETPAAFLQEAIDHPSVVLDTLLAEYPAREVTDDDETRTPPPYPCYLFGVNRRLAGLADVPKSEVVGHMSAIVDIFTQAGIT
jgi:hypothetical protein